MLSEGCLKGLGLFSRRRLYFAAFVRHQVAAREQHQAAQEHHAQGCLKIVQAALGAYLGAENGILNNHRLKTVGLGYGLKARIRID